MGRKRAAAADWESERNKRRKTVMMVMMSRPSGEQYTDQRGGKV
jgi:hypothetical protein